MPILVSFLVFSGSGPHFNPYLAETKINWLDPLSECKICTCFASSQNFPPFQFLLHSNIPVCQRCLLKPWHPPLLHTYFIRRNITVVDFCLLNLVSRCQEVWNHWTLLHVDRPNSHIAYLFVQVNYVSLPILSNSQHLACTCPKSFSCYFLSEVYPDSPPPIYFFALFFYIVLTLFWHTL